MSGGAFFRRDSPKQYRYSDRKEPNETDFSEGAHRIYGVDPAFSLHGLCGWGREHRQRRRGHGAGDQPEQLDSWHGGCAGDCGGGGRRDSGDRAHRLDQQAFEQHRLFLWEGVQDLLPGRAGDCTRYRGLSVCESGTVPAQDHQLQKPWGSQH